MGCCASEEVTRLPFRQDAVVISPHRRDWGTETSQGCCFHGLCGLTMREERICFTCECVRVRAGFYAAVSFIQPSQTWRIRDAWNWCWCRESLFFMEWWFCLEWITWALILKTVHGHIYSPLRDSTRHGKTDHAAKVEALKNMSCI